MAKRLTDWTKYANIDKEKMKGGAKTAFLKYFERFYKKFRKRC